MRQKISNYRDTSVPWGTTQGQIVKMLADRKIYDVQFTNVSAETAKRSGLDMPDNTIAIMLVFQKEEILDNGLHGTIPVRIIVPGIDTDNKTLNQYYRLLYWYLKSKFEAIDTGLVEFAEEFMAHLQISSGNAFGRLWDRFKTGYYRAIGSGQMPDANLLPPVIDDKDDDNG